MDIMAALQREHSKNQINKVTRYIGKDSAKFAQLMKLLAQGSYQVRQNAAWSLSCCAEQHPELVKPYLSILLKMVSQKDATVSIKRNIIRLLQFVDIPLKFQGKAVKICLNFLVSRTETIAVKVFSMTVVSHIAVGQPSLAKELIYILEDQLPYASAGFRSRARKIMARHKL